MTDSDVQAALTAAAWEPQKPAQPQAQPRPRPQPRLAPSVQKLILKPPKLVAQVESKQPSPRPVEIADDDLTEASGESPRDVYRQAISLQAAMNRNKDVIPPVRVVPVVPPPGARMEPSRKRSRPSSIDMTSIRASEAKRSTVAESPASSSRVRAESPPPPVPSDEAHVETAVPVSAAMLIRARKQEKQQKSKQLSGVTEWLDELEYRGIPTLRLVYEVANSMSLHMRKDISNFIDLDEFSTKAKIVTLAMERVDEIEEEEEQGETETKEPERTGLGARTHKKSKRGSKRKAGLHMHTNVSAQDQKMAALIANAIADMANQPPTPPAPPPPAPRKPRVVAASVILPQKGTNMRAYAASATEVLAMYLTAGFNMEPMFIEDPVARDHYQFVDLLLPKVGVLAPMTSALRQVFSHIRSLPNPNVNRLLSTELMMPPFQSSLVTWIMGVYNNSMYASCAVIPTKNIISLNMRMLAGAVAWFAGYKRGNPNSMKIMY